MSFQIALVLATLFALCLPMPACGEGPAGCTAGKGGHLAEENIAYAGQQKRKVFRKGLGRPSIRKDLLSPGSPGSLPPPRVVRRGSRDRWPGTDRFLITVLLFYSCKQCR